MATEKQIAANRLNGLKGGVKTPEGKAVSRFNAHKHGIFTAAVTDHDSESFPALLDELFEQFKPVGVAERMMVDKLAVTYLRMQRCARAEKTHYIRDWTSVSGRPGQFRYHETVFTLGLYDARLTNQFIRLLRELKEWQRVRLAEPEPPAQLAQAAPSPDSAQSAQSPDPAQPAESSSPNPAPDGGPLPIPGNEPNPAAVATPPPPPAHSLTVPSPEPNPSPAILQSAICILHSALGRAPVPSVCPPNPPVPTQSRPPAAPAPQTHEESEESEESEKPDPAPLPPLKNEPISARAPAEAGPSVIPPNPPLPAQSLPPAAPVTQTHEGLEQSEESEKPENSPMAQMKKRTQLPPEAE